MQDPYFLVRDELEASIRKAKNCRERAENGDERALQVMGSALTSAEVTLGELSEAVSIMAATPSKFQLTSEEVNRRQGQLDKIKDDLRVLKGWEAVRRKEELEHRQQEMRPFDGVSAGSSPYDGIDARSRAAADEQFESGALRQQEMMAQQDEDLDDLGEMVVNIGEMGRKIGEELDDQGRLLEELDEDTEKTSGRIAQLNKKLNVMLKKNPTCQLGMVAGLIVLLVILAYFTFT